MATVKWVVYKNAKGVEALVHAFVVETKTMNSKNNNNKL
jgi:hypothetical protein